MKFLKKKLLLVAIVAASLTVSGAVTKKLIPDYNDCTTQTAFWGTRCCRYLVIMNTIPGPVTVQFEKCCDYRFFFPTNCESHATGIFE
jgi:hypothetical protein